MVSKERLGVIKRIHKQIIESNKIEMETGSLAAGDVVHDHLFQLFSEKHTDWLIEQAERFEVLVEYHDETLAQNKFYREFLEQAFKADDLEDIWNIEDEYRALESESE